MDFLHLNCFATAAFSTEGLVAGELRRLGMQNVHAVLGGVSFTSDLAGAFLCCLRLRFADRVMLELALQDVLTFEDWFQLVRSVEWEQLLPPDAKINVNGKCARSQLMSISDCQSVCKKAIIERLRKARGQKVFPETGFPYSIHFSIHENHARLCLDLCGEGLSRRGYRTWNGEAPLRETLAAVMVEVSPWRPGMPLYDPCCGTGTLLIEAAFREGHRAPGMLRSFACENYAFTDQNQLKQIREQVKSEFEIDRIQNIAGSDIDDNALVLARRHIHQAGLDGHIQVHRQDLASLTMDLTNGVFLCNPPYGERMGDQKSCRRLYAAMGKLFRRNPTWSMTVIATDPAFEEFFGMKADKRRRVYNGRLECQILTFFAK